MQTSVEENVKFSIRRGSYQYLLMKSHTANFPHQNIKLQLGKQRIKLQSSCGEREFG